MEDTRRSFLKTSGGLVAGGMATSFAAGAAYAAEKTEAGSAVKMGGGGRVTEHKLRPLPYAYDALEPHISEEILRIHHDKHHAGYVKGLNSAEAELAKARATGDYSMIQHLMRTIAFAQGGVILHDLYWQSMAAPGMGGGGEPDAALAAALEKDFGGVEAFKAELTEAAKSVEGSGWGVVYYRYSDKRIMALQVENHQNLVPADLMPLLCVDVWEHAYYLQYKNMRADYLKAWWNVVNWKTMAMRYSELKTRLTV